MAPGRIAHGAGANSAWRWGEWRSLSLEQVALSPKRTELGRMAPRRIMHGAGAGGARCRWSKWRGRSLGRMALAKVHWHSCRPLARVAGAGVRVSSGRWREWRALVRVAGAGASGGRWRESSGGRWREWRALARVASTGERGGRGREWLALRWRASCKRRRTLGYASGRRRSAAARPRRKRVHAAQAGAVRPNSKFSGLRKPTRACYNIPGRWIIWVPTLEIF